MQATPLLKQRDGRDINRAKPPLMGRTGWSLTNHVDSNVTTPALRHPFCIRRGVAIPTLSVRSTLLFLQRIHQQFEVSHLDVAFAGGAHDVVEDGGEFHNLEAVLAEVAVATDVAVAETEDVAEFMRKCAGGK